MAVVTIPSEQRTLRDPAEVRSYLASINIRSEQWEADRPLATDATAEQVLAAYSQQLEQLKQEGGYVHADVIDVTSDTPGLDAMLAKFNIEHSEGRSGDRDRG
jgi:1,2-dihydroxy-3-keto-5-methylthiopentene dioxygenase